MESITITVVLLVISCILYKLFTSAKVTTIPGPKGYPLIGCGFELNLDNIYEKCYEYAEKYGDIYQIRIFQTKYIVLNSQEMIQKAFCGEKYKQYLNHRAWFFFSDHFHAKNHNIGYYQNPHEKAYGEMKKALAKGLHVYGDGTPQFEEHVKSEILRLIDTIDGFQGEEFDVVTLLRESLSNLISILIIGERAEKEDIDGFWKLVWSQEVFASPASTIILGMFPFLVQVPGYYKNEYDRILIAKEKVVEKYFRRMKKTRKPGIIRGIVDWYLEQQEIEQNEGREPFMTDTRIINLVLEIVFTGIITTWSALSSVMLCLVNHTECQKTLQIEIDKITDDLPSLEDRRRLPFTEAVLLESFRYLTTAPLLGPHVCAEDVNFEGYLVKRGTTIFSNVWFIHHDEKIWGDPWEFRPERFLDDHGDVPNTHPYLKSWLPFGVGRRQCPGENLARSRLFLYVGSLMKAFTFLPSEGRCGTCDPRMGKFNKNLMFRPKPFYCRTLKRHK